ncbi:MAG: fibronectin type III domain-containing protein [candidate division Zixibacteria bacterium]|nr:fibronectin type III domain-containing protein [candidate division Zixibacteria bacterium]
MRIIRDILLIAILPLLVFSLLTCSKPNEPDEDEPVLAVSLKGLRFGTDQTSKSFNITNSGEGKLTWSILDNRAWITVSPTSGNTTTETDQITVSINRPSMPAGENTGSVDISSNNGYRASVYVTASRYPVPDPPTLSAPPNGSTISDNTPYFNWSDATYAHRYELIVDDNSSFLSPIINPKDLSSSSYTAPSSLSDALYYWKVRAKNSSGTWGGWSTRWSFTVETSSSLSEATVTPGGGTTVSTYTYSVVFTDPVSNAPRTAEVLVDGSAYSLSKVSGDFSSGATYEYQTTLAEGSHTYRFRFHDHQNTPLYYPVNGYETGPIVTVSTETVYDSSVVAVDEQDSLSLSAVSGSVYTYNYTGLPPQIEVGDIIMSTDTGGYLRKVTSATTSGNQIVLSTDQASLAEAFQRIAFDTTLTISLEGASFKGTKPWGREAYLAAGVQIRDGQIILDGKILFDGLIDGNPVSIRIISGSFGFQPSLDVGCDIGVFSQEIHAIASGTLSLDVMPEVEASAGFSTTGEVLIVYLPIPLEWASIPASIDFCLYAGFEAGMDIGGQATFGMSGQTQVNAGGRYKDGNFSSIWSQSSQWLAGSSTWDADGDAYAKVYLRPEISIKVFHVAGPYIDVLPYLDFEGAVTSDPYCWEWGIYAGLEANAGLELDIFVSSASFNIPLYSTETKLAGAEDCPETDDITPPAAISNLAASNPTTSSITLHWTAPGDDGYSGTASAYDIRYFTSPITEYNWGSALRCTGEPQPGNAGVSQSYVVEGLSPNTLYYFAVKTADEVPNWSPLSNIPSGTTTHGQEGYEQEPNNDPASANTILDGQTLSCSIDPTGDKDWLKITIGSASDVSFIFAMHADNHLDVDLYDGDGTTYLSGTTPRDGESLTYTNLPVGTYYLRVRDWDGGVVGSYTVNYTATTFAPGTDNYEPDRR